MTSPLNLPVTRFLHTLEIVAKEGRHLTYSWNGLFLQIIDVEWGIIIATALEHGAQLVSYDTAFPNYPELVGYLLTGQQA